MLENSYKKTIATIQPEDAKDLGIIKNFTKDIIIDDNVVYVMWPDTNKLSKILSATALKRDLILQTINDPNAKKYYKPYSNKENNFRRIIDLEIIKGSKTTNNIKLNDLKMHQTDYKSNFILKSDKTISDLKQDHIEEQFSNFFASKNTQETSGQAITDSQEEFYDMNPIRKLSLDYKILGAKFLELYEVTPDDQIKALFNDVESRLVSLDNKPYIEVMYKSNNHSNN